MRAELKHRLRLGNREAENDATSCRMSRVALEKPAGAGADGGAGAGSGSGGPDASVSSADPREDAANPKASTGGVDSCGAEAGGGGGGGAPKKCII